MTSPPTREWYRLLLDVMGTKEMGLAAHIIPFLPREKGAKEIVNLTSFLKPRKFGTTALLIKKISAFFKIKKFQSALSRIYCTVHVQYIHRKRDFGNAQHTLLGAMIE